MSILWKPCVVSFMCRRIPYCHIVAFISSSPMRRRSAAHDHSGKAAGGAGASSGRTQLPNRLTRTRRRASCKADIRPKWGMKADGGLEANGGQQYSKLQGPKG